jgi:uncharacterized glyoxalase superfamily protein PhnB
MQPATTHIEPAANEGCHTGGVTDAPTGWRAPDLIPALSYEDAPAAIEWLERAFGFERHAVYESEGGSIEHAELRVGSGMIMLGTAHEPGGERYERFPVSAPGPAGAITAGFYVIVGDPDAHYERAKAAGAEIVTGLADQEYGSRDYTARDPEGHLWTFGTYRPSAG